MGAQDGNVGEAVSRCAREQRHEIGEYRGRVSDQTHRCWLILVELRRQTIDADHAAVCVQCIHPQLRVSEL